MWEIALNPHPRLLLFLSAKSSPRNERVCRAPPPRLLSCRARPTPPLLSSPYRHSQGPAVHSHARMRTRTLEWARMPRRTLLDSRLLLVHSPLSPTCLLSSSPFLGVLPRPTATTPLHSHTHTLGSTVVQALGTKLRVRQQIVATAITYIRRFYAKCVPTALWCGVHAFIPPISPGPPPAQLWLSAFVCLRRCRQFASTTASHSHVHH